MVREKTELPMTEDINVQQINMFGMSCDQAERDPNNQMEQDDSDESSNDTIDDASHHQPLDLDTAKIHSRIDACIKARGTLPAIQVGDLLGCTFISEPDGEGEQICAKISSIDATGDTTMDGMKQRYKFKCEVKDKVFEEIMICNWMLDQVDCDHHKDDMCMFESIKAHCLHPNPTGEKKMSLDNAPKGSCQVLVDWASWETSCQLQDHLQR